MFEKSDPEKQALLSNDDRVRFTIGVMLEATGNLASHIAKAAPEEGLAHAFTYDADERRFSEWRA